MTRIRRAWVALGLALLAVRLASLDPALAGADPIAGSGQPSFSWPLAPPHRVVSRFAPPSEPWLPGQRGVVLAGHVGEQIVAAGAGTVSFTGQVGGIAVVSIVHPAADGLAADSLRTTYEPVMATVHRGQAVVEGQPIGRLTSLGSECAPRACLHWGLLHGSTYLDPLTLLDLGQVRLLPLTVGRFGPDP